MLCKTCLALAQHACISDQVSIGSTHRLEYFCEILRGHLLNVPGVHFAATLQNSEYRLLVVEWTNAILCSLAVLSRLCLMLAKTSADVSFVSLDHAVHLLRQFTCQSVADSMGHKPRTLVLSYVEVPHKLMRAHSFFAGREQMDRE